MAHGVDLTVIAEGVETADQLDILRDLGCDQVQGYYFGRAVPARDLPATPL
jgi:EAL domain-containing protein (putative c-di-GMP-specific phosphodiesterase class I)